MVLISDLLAERDGLFRGLKLLRSRGHDVLVFHVLDDDELDFPFNGPTRFEGLETARAPELQSPGAARGLPGGAGRVPGGSPPRLHPAQRRLRPAAHQPAAGRRPGRVPEQPAWECTTGTGARIGIAEPHAASLHFAHDHFVHPSLLWGLPVVGVPVLIHLINMLRHRRVAWAAMEFLLVSQKKNRTWVMLKQLLLLLLRMAAVAAVVLMVAQPLLRDQWGSLLGSQRTHHIVLLDDSFSMSDHWGDTSAFDAGQGGGRSGSATRPPARRSRSRSRCCGSPGPGSPAAGCGPTSPRSRSTPTSPTGWPRSCKTIDASQTAAGPAAALEAVGQLLGDDEGERRVVYLVSDFRARQWDEPARAEERLARLEPRSARRST